MIEWMKRMVFATAYRIVYALTPEDVMPLIVPVLTAEKIVAEWRLGADELALIQKQVRFELERVENS